MSWKDIGSAVLGFLGHGNGGPVYPGYVPPPQPPNMGSNAGVPKPLGGSSGLSAYAQPPVAPPPFVPSSQGMGMSQYNMAGNLSGPVGSTVQPANGEGDGGTPWYKNPAILNTIAGAGSMLLQSHNESQNRAQQQQRIDLEKQQYADQHARQQQTSQAIDPIIARLLGQMMQQRQGGSSGHQG